MAFTFRLRFHLPESERLGATEISFPIPSYPDVLANLEARQSDATIADFTELVLRADGFASEADARDAASVALDVLMLTFATQRLGADFGGRQPTGLVMKYGLEMLEREIGQRVLNDRHGITVFETDPPPRFVSVGPMRGVATRAPDRFQSALKQIVSSLRKLSDRDRLAFQLYNASFFERSAETRFLVLLMAVEALLELQARPGTSRRHVAELMRLTAESVELARNERASLLKSLGWLCDESIGQAGRKLARTLGNRTYLGRKPAAFFTYAYDLRSRLVHGLMPRPTDHELGSVAPAAKEFVSDLLTRSYHGGAT